MNVKLDQSEVNTILDALDSAYWDCKRRAAALENNPTELGINWGLIDEENERADAISDLIDKFTSL